MNTYYNPERMSARAQRFGTTLPYTTYNYRAVSVKDFPALNINMKTFVEWINTLSLPKCEVSFIMTEDDEPSEALLVYKDNTSAAIALWTLSYYDMVVNAYRDKIYLSDELDAQLADYMAGDCRQSHCECEGDDECVDEGECEGVCDMDCDGGDM